MIALENIELRQGSFELSDLSLELASGEYGVLMGRSGCGKTTLLEAVCGLRNIAGGRIILGGRDVTQLPPAERGVGYVPQDRALFPTMLVREQLAFALVLRALGQAEIGGDAPAGTDAGAVFADKVNAAGGTPLPAGKVHFGDLTGLDPAKRLALIHILRCRRRL